MAFEVFIRKRERTSELMEPPNIGRVDPAVRGMDSATIAAAAGVIPGNAVS